ncbi:RCC1 and BTB domain-containing protein 1 [Folsomia candida]|uniref:RCC1 and BTB domain-containing protein 1 n=1 Tax=Folsomia candida TaxID=158441 RepID=UPI0016054CAC|nr:RCC1 and BTB domain-containing protein 1 [Folsomia candida]
MFSNEWKETEGEAPVIEIKDTKYEIFEAFLFYIYNDKVKFAGNEYENIFNLMQLADSYCDLKIRQNCEKILIRNISEESAFFLVRNASLAKASNLERNIVNFILDKRLLDLNLSPQELVELLGMDAFHTISLAALHRL